MKCLKFKEEINHEKLASELAKRADYDGLDILEVCKLALTDVNFHPEAKVIQKIISNVENYPNYKYKDDILVRG